MKQPQFTMSKCIQNVCIQKPENEPETEMIIAGGDGLEEVKETDAPEMYSDKKTDEVIEPQKQPGFLWRMSSGLYNTSKGAVTGTVGYGYSGAKWVAGKSYDATSAVVVGTKNVATGVASKVPIPKSVRIPFVKRKDKKE